MIGGSLLSHVFLDKNVLITGGTGTFGREFVKWIIEKEKPKRIIIFSRDELKQHEMRTNGYDDERIRFFIGDVRDKERLKRALHGVDIVIHAAALKQVPACEYNPFEAVKTNVIGTQNVIETAIDARVERVLAISTDKGCMPTNTYGTTKAMMEKLIINGNAYASRTKTRFSCIRYGNVTGSRGSVVPLMIKQRDNGQPITITDTRMTRFWMQPEKACEIVAKAIEMMHGGEIFIPKIPSIRIMDLKNAIAPDSETIFIGIREGEKLHESLVGEQEAPLTIDTGDFYIIESPQDWFQRGKIKGEPFGRQRYVSDENDIFLDNDEIRRTIGHLN
jgi:UDP-N-acetylglucosamine 4,6-dehydratase